MPALSTEQIATLTTKIFVAAGAPSDHAEQVSEAVVDNHLAGHDSHGMLRIPQYVDAILTGSLDPTARPAILEETASTALVDGNATFGQVAANFAADIAIEKALATRVAAVSIVRMNHTGRLALFTERAARRDVVMFMTVGSGGARYTVAPFGGAAPSLGTNPIALSMPTGDAPPVTLDFATAAIAAGKVKHALAQGEPVPAGSIVDSHGRATTDPAQFFRGGHLVPFGAHKGYALSVMAELLSGPLSAADAYTTTSKRTGGFIFAVHAATFRNIESYRSAMGGVLDRLRSVPPAPGFDRVLVPGDIEANSRKARGGSVIPIPDKTWDAVCATAAKVGLSPDELLDGRGNKA